MFLNFFLVSEPIFYRLIGHTTNLYSTTRKVVHELSTEMDNLGLYKLPLYVIIFGLLVGILVYRPDLFKFRQI